MIGGTTVPVWDSQAETHFEVLHSIERYDPSSGTWTDRANLPMDGPAVTTGSYSTVTFTPDGSLYVMTVDIPGGIRLQRLDALEARWSEEDTPPEPLTPAAMYPTGDGRLILFGSASQSDSSSGTLRSAGHLDPGPDDAPIAGAQGSSADLACGDRDLGGPTKASKRLR